MLARVHISFACCGRSSNEALIIIFFDKLLPCGMAYEHSFEGLELNGVTELNRDELGRGAYGRVYAVNYCQTMCAAKEIHSILVEGVGQLEMQQTIESFIRECRQCSTLRHPNVIQFLGVYYPPETGGANNMRLPVMVMEMMADSLTSFVDKHEKIPVHIKYSIVHDVSLGLCYLHNHDPPIVHRDLSPNNVLLTVHHVAKISDLGLAKVIKTDSRKTMTKAPGTVDFMPLEALSISPIYGPPMDVFSFAGIILHIFNQQWPRPLDQVQFDPKTRRRVALSEVERRQQYLDKMIGEAEVLRPLVEECLDDDPTVRPTTATVCERIRVSKDAYMKESPQEYVMLYQDNQLLKTENLQQKLRIEQLTSEIEQIKSRGPLQTSLDNFSEPAKLQKKKPAGAVSLFGGVDLFGGGGLGNKATTPPTMTAAPSVEEKQETVTTAAPVETKKSIGGTYIAIISTIMHFYFVIIIIYFIIATYLFTVAE